MHIDPYSQVKHKTVNYKFYHLILIILQILSLNLLIFTHFIITNEFFFIKLTNFIKLYTHTHIYIYIYIYIYIKLDSF